MTAELLLTNGAGLVDAEDLAELRRWRWFELGGYVVRQQRTASGGAVLIYLHRFLMQARPSEVVDHINNNRLDNRRCNLRLCTQSQNLANRPAPMPHGYRGVYPEGAHTWRAQIKVRGKNKRLGTFRTPEAAARAYDVAALAAFSHFARLNFPGETPAQLGLWEDPFDAPAPAQGVDFYEIRQEQRWRAQQFTGDAALGEALAGELGIPW
jgi:hypothetical protein